MGFKEVTLSGAGSTAKNSTSLRRAPGPPDEATRGSSTNYPFWPGGFEEPDFTQVRGRTRFTLRSETD